MREAIEKLVQEELDRANAKFPPFSSRHEGYAVLLEEVEEAEEDLESIKFYLNQLWSGTKKNFLNTDLRIYINEIYCYAINGMAEFGQIAAMARKFQMALGDNNEPKD